MRLKTLILLMTALMTVLYLGCSDGDTSRLGSGDSDSDSDSDGDGDSDSDSDGDADVSGAVGFVGDHGMLGVNGKDIVDAHGDRIQVKGMSWYWSMWQGAYFREDVVRAVVEDFNITLVRVPLGIENNNGNAGYWHMDDAERAEHLAMVEEVVQAAIAEGVYVIIDWHDHWSDEHVDLAKEFFEYMGGKYGHQPNVIWEIWNEPDYGVDWSVIQNYANEVIPIIRSHSNNMILVGSSNYSFKITDVLDGPINDNNVAYSFHFYVENENHMFNVAQAYVEALHQENLPVFVSEWGLEVTNSDSYEGASFLSSDVDDSKVGPWMDWMDDLGLSWAYWSVCSQTESSAIFNASAIDNVGNWDYNVDYRSAGRYMYDYFN